MHLMLMWSYPVGWGNFDLSLHLHIFVIYVSSEGSDKSAYPQRLALVLVG